ncbi:MAG: hypothetical protein WC661_16770 [Opitutaceae bacterium]|jgi:hypothetical protein
MSSYPMPPSSASPDGFQSVKSKNKSTLRDYVVYGVILTILLGVAGGSVYYFTRPKAEKEQLRAKLDHTLNDVALRDGKQPVEPPELKAPKNLDGILDDGSTAPKSPSPTGNNPTSKTGSVSTYAGGKQNGVLLSDDPALPKPSLAFIQFAEALKVSGVLQGASAKAMLNGRLFRAGAVIAPELGVIFVGVDEPNKRLILRDKTGAELRLAY